MTNTETFTIESVSVLSNASIPGVSLAEQPEQPQRLVINGKVYVEEAGHIDSYPARTPDEDEL